jgi:Domain of unknown function (DUF3597)
MMMSIFGRIKDAIFGHKDTAGQDGQAAPALDTAAATTAAVAISQVDVEGILAGLAAKAGHPSNWKTSIVDLMKLLGLDSSLSERVNLAKELGYTGDTNDTATMNVWLIKQVMTKLAENGGKVSADLMH